MLFKHKIYLKIIEGKKTETRRPIEKAKGRQRYEVGKTYPILNGYKKPDHWIHILYRRREPLSAMTEEDAHKEGFETLADFKEVWAELYGKWRPNKVVWVYGFEMLTEKPKGPQQKSLNGKST